MATAPDKPKRRGSLRNLKTAVSARIRSKPTIEGQRYLDLYVLQRDRFRWLRLIEQAETSIRSIDSALRKIGFDPNRGESAPATQASAGAGRTAAGKTRRTPARRTKAA